MGFIQSQTHNPQLILSPPFMSLFSKNSLSFFDHLDELRSRLIKIFLCIFVAAVVAYQFIDQILFNLIHPVGHLIFTSPAEAFTTRFALTLWAGVFLSSPLIVYHIWKFVACGLKEHEHKYIIFYGPLSLIFFLMGVFFAYFLIIPISITFLLSFSSDLLVPMITVKSYISFVGTLILSFGVIFELPLVLMFLARIGIATPAFLEQKRSHAIVLILIVSAILTPPDLITLFLMAAPLVILYEIGIIVVKMTYRPKMT